MFKNKKASIHLVFEKILYPSHEMGRENTKRKQKATALGAFEVTLARIKHTLQSKLGRKLQVKNFKS